MLKLEKNLRSEVGKEVANKLKCYQKVLKRNQVCLWVTESFFTHNLNISIITLVYKLIRQAKLFCNYCFVLYCIVFNLFVYLLPNPLFWEGKNIKSFDCWFKASRLLSKLLTFSPKLRPGALGTRLLIPKNVYTIFASAIICRRTSRKIHISFGKSLNNCRLPRWISKTVIWLILCIKKRKQTSICRKALPWSAQVLLK